SALNLGACVRLARTQATWGNPRPTTTTSPSCSSLAPAAAIISLARTSGMVVSLEFLFRKWCVLQSGRGYQNLTKNFKRDSRYMSPAKPYIRNHRDTKEAVRESRFDREPLCLCVSV